MFLINEQRSPFGGLLNRSQFTRRDKIALSDAVKNTDRLIIICTITSVPTALVSQPPCRSVPEVLLDTIGDLLDDPTYSDVEFVLPSRRPGSNAKRILAARKLLQRTDYFERCESKYVH